MFLKDRCCYNIVFCTQQLQPDQISPEQEKTKGETHHRLNIPYLEYIYMCVIRYAKRGLIAFSIACTWQPVT